jgi:CMP-N,N'-diacetyllegionaminic acid synthase
MLAIIPARGGSKGLMRKNTKLLAGLPLICHTIKTALASKSIKQIIVSTDDDEIATIAKNYGAEVPFMRPATLANDTSMVMDTYFYVLDKLGETTSQPVEKFVALLPTVPLRLPEDIDKAVDLFNSKDADSVISVVKSPVPIDWYRKISKNGILKNYLPEFDAIKNRQELEQTYIPNGAIYVFRTNVLRSKRKYYTNKTYPYIMPSERSADIDDLLDFEWAEYLLNTQKTK